MTLFAVELAWGQIDFMRVGQRFSATSRARHAGKNQMVTTVNDDLPATRAKTQPISETSVLRGPMPYAMFLARWLRTPTNAV